MQIRISDPAGGLLVLALFASACGRGERPAAPLDQVRIGRSNLLTNAPIVIADAEGYFRQEGIAVEYVAIPSVTVQALPGLQDGDVDVVSSVISIGLINAVGGGANFRIVADRGTIDPNTCEPWGIIGRKALFDGKTIDAALLRGRRISTNPLGQSGYLTDLFLRKHGLTLKDMEIVRLPPNVEPQAMSQGRIDIVTRSDPQLNSMLSSGHVLLAGATSLAPGSPLAVLVYGPRLLATNRDLGQRFMRAYLRGVRKYAEGPTSSNITIVAKGLGVDTADITKMCWLSTNPNGLVSEKALSDYQAWAVESGALERTVEPSHLLDTAFATQASAALDAERRSR
jgi:NitT/TauT family transport system substrate-binding protein